MTEAEEIKEAFGHFSCSVMATAISGLADAAIIANQRFNEHHSLAWVAKLAASARELRSGDALLKSEAAKTTFEDEGREEFPCDYEDTFYAGVKQGRTELAREILKLRQEQKDEEARRLHRDETRDDTKPEAGANGVSPVSEG